MAMTWINALKVFNKNNDKWIIPAKGTADYAKVRALMGVEVRKKK